MLALLLECLVLGDLAVMMGIAAYIGDLAGLRLLGLLVGMSRWGRNLTLIRGKVYLPPPESA